MMDKSAGTYCRAKRALVAITLVSVLVTVSASACLTSTNNPASSGGIVLAAEPTGGSWKPFVLNSSDVPRSIPPPSRDSSQFNQEVNELKALQLNRTPAVNESIGYWNNGSAVRWNEIARSLVIKNGTSAPMASRVYALLSVAQYDALVSAWNNKYTYNRSSPHDIDPSIQPAVQTTSDPAYPSDHAAVAGASSAVLSYLYPNETAWLSTQAAADEESRLAAGVNFRSDITAGDSLGRTVALAVIARARNDGSNTPWNGTVPTGPDKWVSTTSPPQPPFLPNWGNVTPWLLNSSDLVMPPSPPVFGSAQFNASLQEVKQIANGRTAEQLQIALFWDNDPPGHWNQIASDLIQSYHLNELRSSRALALMNTAAMDAGICCWKAKYDYWYPRPIQADPTIKTAFPTPNFPSYTSGHSDFSSASGGVLSYIFPNEKSELQAKVQEASLSRVYAGIHYRFDCDQGVMDGSKVAQYAIQRGENDGSPP
ncbi:MAG: vanadium-dependent haloperoxidase [Euryarchaeota archaeon]|nr:vanadium-dependent haloperoxidase [Euryarchaeota archaeon]